MAKNIRIVAFFEGLSLLVLFFVAMPLKYVYGMPMAVRIVGMVHGILFLMFVYAATMVATEKSWPRKRLYLAYLSACLPFGAWWFERKYLKIDEGLALPRA